MKAHVRTQRLNSWLQMFLVLAVVVLANSWASRTFWRVDLTADRLYSLDLASRGLMYRLEKPLIAKVYFTEGLQTPYNNHQQLLVDKLEDLRAYSKGLMEIEVTDPTNIPDLESEAQRFGIQPIQYRYKAQNVSEMRKVYMGLALVYGDEQQVLPAVTQIATLEYDLARAVKALVSDEERPVLGYTTGHGEPDIGTVQGPVQGLRTRLQEDFELRPIPLGGEGQIDEDVDALWMIGPQQPVSSRAQWQLDQYLMRGGAMAVFLTNTKPDMRTLRPQSVYHGLEPLLGHWGVKLNRDVVVDRARNGVMRFPVRQGKYVVQMPVNYPLIPRASDLDRDSVVVKDLDSMLFPFVSSLEVADPPPQDVDVTVLARSSEASGAIKGIRTIDPNAYKIVAPTEVRGQHTLLLSMKGTFPSYFAGKDIPAAPDPGAARDDPAAMLRESAPTRLVVAGSADFVANNVPFLLNLADWMVQDESLIGIRSKQLTLPALEPVELKEARLLKALNLLGGSLVLVLFGFVRWALRRRSGGVTEPVKASP